MGGGITLGIAIVQLRWMIVMFCEVVCVVCMRCVFDVVVVLIVGVFLRIADA